ncbi:class I SAM-dependent methyltransferase [Novosphingobium beihaiensis]|uniref:Class I SAM-dependent methyltransferase n=1 Tax=Novosphingobium beihaiensis TaxID=2930389 RepID=A0ABT0BLV0_9SPHN|nr:class I SAM-dependent methyltransferase [Novosphingobium beihaiensis]MCJ2186009.1 class I SAM-dependent methyltransferase [Novosphingobium beihaiensis]
MTDQHETLVRHQFGAASAAYVSSAVHANGDDLAAIAAHAGHSRPHHALDLGTGGGHVAYAIAPYAGNVTASDLAPEMLAAVAEEARQRAIGNIAMCEAAAEALPFADGTFDFLACRFSTHHWRDPQAGLREARRVLASGAPALFADVVAPPSAAADTHLQAIELLRDPSHVRNHTAAGWASMLERAGFTIVTLATARLRMDFASWTARMGTPPERSAAIRALQKLASADVRKHFAIEQDGSFTLDTVLIEAR